MCTAHLAGSQSPSLIPHVVMLKALIQNWLNSKFILQNLQIENITCTFTASELNVKIELRSIQFPPTISCYFKRHSPVYIRSYSWQHMSEHEPHHEVGGMICRPLRQVYAEAQIWGRAKKHFCSIKGSCFLSQSFHPRRRTTQSNDHKMMSVWAFMIKI